MNKEEQYLKQIISSCELVLDDIDQGAKISQANFNMLGYAERTMFRIQQEINRQLAPSNTRTTLDRTSRTTKKDE